MQKVLLFGFLVFITSCSGLHEDTENLVSLGDEYYFFRNGWESYIFLNESPEGSSRSGVTIVLPEILKYKYDDQFIIVKSRHYESSIINYQIVNKSVDDGLVQSLNRQDFDLRREELNIKLDIP